MKITALDPLQAGFVCMVAFCQNSYIRGINHIFTACFSVLPYICVPLFLPNFSTSKPWLQIGFNESVQNPPTQNSSKFAGISHTESGTENVCDVHSWLYLYSSDKSHIWGFWCYRSYSILFAFLLGVEEENCTGLYK